MNAPSAAPSAHHENAPPMRRISVVIPSYNHARFLPITLPSVLNQDYPNLELVIVDDGSSDGSPELIEQLIAGASTVDTIFIRQANAGAHAAIMRGVAASSGEVLTILNSDDYYLPGRLSELMRNVPAEGDFMAFSLVHFVNDAGLRLTPDAGHMLWYDRALREASACPTIGYGLLRNNFSLTSGNLVFTRTLYDAIGGFAHYKLCHDWDFLMKAVLRVEPIFVPKPLMCYRVHDSNTTLSVMGLQEEEGTAAYGAYFTAAAEQPPANRLAPCARYWPGYFERFIDACAPWFSPEPIRKAVGLPPPPPAPAWVPWGQAFSLPAAQDFGYLAAPALNQDALALQRDDAFQRAFAAPAAAPAAAHEALPAPPAAPAPPPAIASPPAETPTPPGLLSRAIGRLARGGLSLARRG